MGVRSFNTESTVYSDKEAGGYKHSPNCLPLRMLALMQWWETRQQRRDHRKIEKLRGTIDRDRKDVQDSLDGWELHRNTWQRRAEAWKKGEDISVEERKAGRFAYDTAYRYMVTVVGPISGTRAVIVDFRTPEGREGALQWYESRYQTCTRNGRRFLGHYESWEETYEEYMYILAKSRDRADQASLRRTLLHGVPKVYWAVATAKRLPN